MATLGPLYHNRIDYYAISDSLPKEQPRHAPLTAVTPNESQDSVLGGQNFYSQEYRPSHTTSTRRSKPEYNAPTGMKISNSDRPSLSLEPQIITNYKPTVPHTPLRSDNLKRRPSLREAARSFRSSKVVKKLRRQGKVDYDVEDSGEAGASASENDGYYHTVPGQRLGCTKPEEFPRSASVVSELSSGLQSSLSFTTHGRGRVSSSASQSSSQMANSSDAASTRTSITSFSGISKRSRNGEDEDIDGDDENDSDRINKRPCSVPALGPEQPLLFACPFSKHDSQRYSAANLDELNYRGCSQSYLTDLARVKQHLYRVHERPAHHCPTCYESFKTQPQYLKHVSSQSCHARPCPFDEKMTAEQLNAIKKKNRGTDPYLGWYEIYKTLFPGSPIPMSPYAAFSTNMDTLESFMDHVVRELPTRLKHHLNLGDLIIDALQAPLRDVLREIRRDFNPMQQQRSDSLPQKMANQVTQATNPGELPHAHNFHQSVTLTLADQDESQPLRPPSIDIPSPNIYLYPPTQPTQDTTGPVPSHATYNNQQAHDSIRINYANQQYQYTVHDTDALQDLDGVTPKAIWPIRESTHSYFVGQHQIPQLHSTYLQIHSDGNWIPELIANSMDQSMNDPAMQEMMGHYFHSNYSDHPN